MRISHFVRGMFLFFLLGGISCTAPSSTEPRLIERWVSCADAACRSILFHIPQSVADITREQSSLAADLRVIEHHLGEISECAPVMEQDAVAYLTVSLSAGDIDDLPSSTTPSEGWRCLTTSSTDMLVEFQTVADKIKVAKFGLPAGSRENLEIYQDLLDELF